MPYGASKDLAKTTGSDKVLRDEAFNVANNIQYDEYQRLIFSKVFY